MKTHWIIAACAAFAIAGCGKSYEEPAATSQPASAATAPAVQTAYELGSKKKGDMAMCVVCVTNDGRNSEETVAETLDYEGKTYAFCSESEKAKFISNPTKYAAKLP